MRKLITICLVVTMMTGVASTSFAAILVDRGLPTANLNNAAGSNRSNVSWAEPELDSVYLVGDDFTLPTAASSYNIDTIRTWLLGERPGTPLGNDFYSVNLYLGSKNGTLSLASSGNITSGTNTSTNPSITFKAVTFSDGENWQGPWQIWEVDFSNLNLVVAGGSQLSFALSGTGDDYLYSIASNAALSDSPQDGADGLYSRWTDQGNGTATYLDSIDSAGNGWDKSSDLNVQVLGVPEPATMALLGLGALSLIRRKK